MPAGRPRYPMRRSRARDELASARLRGASIPAISLDSTAGPVDLRQLAMGRLALFVYPHATGLPDAPVPGWDSIPGARGCTAQACGFRDSHERLSALGVTVAGLSVQTREEQRAFSARVGLRYPLISDPQLRLASALGLPTFVAGGRVFYRRLTLISVDGRVAEVLYPIAIPDRNASDVLAWFRSAAHME